MYTTAQLISLFTSISGVSASAAVSLTLDAYATQNQTGGLTDAQTLTAVTQLAIQARPADPEPTPDPAPSGGGGSGATDVVVGTPQALKTYYASITRMDFTAIGPADGLILDTLATQVGVGRLPASVALTAVAHLAGQSISVANLAYQFFTGVTPYASGVDYLVSPSGGNPSNLSSAYYQSFNLENRYINFAVNLGKVGEGQARFTAAYGGLSLEQALGKAYAEIFGTTPTDAKVHELLDAVLTVGGQTMTRAQYFALYGQDGANGIGTKAAMVGWLLAEAVKADLGPYAKAQDAFLVDLGRDGLAHFHVDLLGAYGPHVAAPVGATIVFTHDQSVSPTASSTALRASDNSDVITGKSGLGADQTISTGDGDDRVTIAGMVDGKIQLGDGDSVVTLQDGLGATGAVTFGRGNNTVYLGGVIQAGASISAAGTNNTLHLTTASANVLGTVSGFQTIVLDAPSLATGFNGVKGAQIIYDMVPSTVGDGVTISIAAYNHETVVLKNTSNAVRVDDYSAAGASNIEVHLDHFAGAVSTTVSYRNNPPLNSGYSADGGSITIASRSATPSRDGKVTLYVDSDSTAGMIYGYVPVSMAGGTGMWSIETLEIRGVGKLTAQIFETFRNVDASRAGDLNLIYAVGGGIGLDGLKTAAVGTFRLSDGSNTLSVALGHAADRDYATPMTFVLGSGADTLVAAKGALGLNNLTIIDQVVFVTAAVTGFQKGVDHLVLDAISHGVVVDVQAQAAGATSLTQALTQVSAKVGANGLAVFTYGGDTYVYLQDDLAGLNGSGAGHNGDGLIKLTGVTGLSIVSGAATGDIHWA